jgi:hypothetical protein
MVLYQSGFALASTSQGRPPRFPLLAALKQLNKPRQRDLRPLLVLLFPRYARSLCPLFLSFCAPLLDFLVILCWGPQIRTACALSSSYSGIFWEQLRPLWALMPAALRTTYQGFCEQLLLLPASSFSGPSSVALNARCLL